MDDLTVILNWVLNAGLMIWNDFIRQPNVICTFVLCAFFVRKAIKVFRKIY